VATLTQGDAAQHAASADRPDVPLWRQKSIGMLERGPEREAAAHPRRYTFLICLLIFSNANEQLILSKKKERKMNSNRKTAIIVGVLFITATVVSVLEYIVILPPILNAPNYLVNVSANNTQVIIGVLLMLINCAAVIVIPFMLFPIFKKHNEALALGYLGSRIIESVILIVGAISLLSLLTLSQEYVQAGAPDAPYFQTLGTLLLSVSDWTSLLGAMIAFSLTALILNYLLYQSKLIPRFISVWGLIGATLLFAAGLLGMFGLSPTSTTSILLTFPIAVNEMVLAVWLIVKGFNSSAIASGSA